MVKQQNSVSEQIYRVTLLMVVLNSVGTAMMLTGVNVALPSIARDLKIDAVVLTWIPMSYLMAVTACVLSFGRLADMYGRKKIYLAGTVGVILTSIATALSDTATTMIIGRLAQGVCAAMLYATNVAVISSAVAPEKRGAAIGYTVSAIYLGLALGPFLSGWLVEYFSWRWTFLLHVPLALVVLYIGIYRIDRDWTAEDLGDFDKVGALVYGIAIILLMLGLSRFENVIDVTLICVGLVGLVFFFKYEQRHPHPVFDVSLFYTNTLFTLACVASLVMYTTTFGNVVLVSLYLQYIKDISPSTVGALLVCQPVVMTAVAPIAGRLSDKFGSRLLALVGMGITGISHVVLSFVDVQSSVYLVIVCLILNGIGFGLFSSPNANAMMGAVGVADYGRAGSAIAVMRVVGQMSSVAVVTLVFGIFVGPRALDITVFPELNLAIRVCFAFGACLCLVFIVFSFFQLRRRSV